MFDLNTTVDRPVFWVIVGLVVLAVAVAMSVAFSRRSRRRSLALRERFGPEYGRTISQYGEGRGERVLQSRLERVNHIEFRELSEADRTRFTSQWAGIQAQFVDSPRAAVAQANELIKEVMRARGYAADTAFEQRAADLSVDHPDVVEHYRVARTLAQTTTNESMNTEQLRQAVVHYRVLFADLLQPPRPELRGSLYPDPVHA
jgi:hypothetical protein